MERILNATAAMAEVVHECVHRVTAPDGREYRVSVLAEPREHVWIGSIEFRSMSDSSVLRTGEETSQPTKEDVIYWAEGLEPVYLDGALRRAK